MKIKSITIRNFRSILNQTVTVEEMLVLVGTNGSGKSAFLKAIEFFYSESLKISNEDFYNRNTEKEIIISITFNHLSHEATELFRKYIQNDTLTIERVIQYNEGHIKSLYHGSTLQHKPFNLIRELGAAKEIKDKFSELVAADKYVAITKSTTKEAILQAMSDWEETNSSECERLRDNGQFFGYKSVAEGYLGRYTKLIFIPAVRDLEEDTDVDKKSAINELLDLVVRKALIEKEEFIEFKENASKQYKKIVLQNTSQDLQQLSSSLSETLSTYAPNTSVTLRWDTMGDFQVPLPKADIQLLEDNFESDPLKVGHGLQRVFIITLLQHLSFSTLEKNSQGQNEENERDLPDYIFMIEEPELYQHPSRQRHLSDVLLKLADTGISGVTEQIQVVYSTHSPLFVGIDRVNQIRKFTKVDHDGGQPRKTDITKVTLDEIVGDLWRCTDQTQPQFTAETLRPRLKTIMTPWMNEGFFSDVVVLVEGWEDRAAIIAAAHIKGNKMESEGISVIPCHGKSNLDRPYLIFKKFKIPIYLIWDNDRGDPDSTPIQNQLLLKVVGEENLEDYPNGVFNDYACCEKNLDKMIEDSIGSDLYNELLNEIVDEFGYNRREDAKKNSIIMEKLITKAVGGGKELPFLFQIIEKIMRKKH